MLYIMTQCLQLHHSCKEDAMMSWTVYLVLSVLSLYPGSVVTTSDQLQTAGVPRILQGNGTGSGQCPSAEERETVRNEIYQTVISAIASTFNRTPDTYSCNGSPGWSRIVFINMTDTSYNCPTGLLLTSYSKRTCGRSRVTCTSTTFSTEGLSYSRVCGRIRGYQYGSTSAFGHSSLDINSHYVDGVSLTHGATGSRQHIWTFAAGLSENTTVFPFECCPCDTPNQRRFPTFVGNDYFCESGLHSAWSGHQFGVFQSNDVLWDGQGCTSNSTCCQFNNPPWFTKNLPNATTDDIELRICATNPYEQEDVPIELIELYVQ